MAQLFAETDDEFASFIEDNYIAQDGFYLKAISPNFVGKVTVHENEPQIEATFEEKVNVADHPVNASIKLTSAGVHTLEGNWDISSVVENTEFTHITNWNSSNNDHDTTFSVTNRSIADMKLKFDFQYFKGGDWTLRNHFAKRFFPEISLGGDFTWDGKKSEVNATNVGFLYTPQEWIRLWLTHSTQGTINSKTNWAQTGVLALKHRFLADANTVLGFDFVHNLENKKSALVAGVETSPAIGVLLKGKANSGGDIEATARVAASANWDVILSAGTHANEVTSKQEALFGIGVEGRLM